MESAKLSKVKNELSAYVERVRKGGRVRIFVRGEAAADLIPVRDEVDDEPIAALLKPGPRSRGRPASQEIVIERRSTR